MPFFYQVIRKGFNDQGTFENRPEGSKEGSQVDMLGKLVELQAEGTKSVKFLREECAWHNLRNSKGAIVAKQIGTVHIWS